MNLQVIRLTLAYYNTIITNCHNNNYCISSTRWLVKHTKFIIKIHIHSICTCTCTQTCTCLHFIEKILSLLQCTKINNSNFIIAMDTCTHTCTCTYTCSKHAPKLTYTSIVRDL